MISGGIQGLCEGASHIRNVEPAVLSNEQSFEIDRFVGSNVDGILTNWELGRFRDQLQERISIYETLGEDRYSDEIDYKLLNELAVNGRAPLIELAETVGWRTTRLL